MARTQILVRRWGPRTRILALFRKKASYNLSYQWRSFLEAFKTMLVIAFCSITAQIAFPGGVSWTQRSKYASQKIAIKPVNEGKSHLTGTIYSAKSTSDHWFIRMRRKGYAIMSVLTGCLSVLSRLSKKIPTILTTTEDIFKRKRCIISKL